VIRSRLAVTAEDVAVTEAYLRRKYERGQFAVGADGVLRMQGARGMLIYALARPSTRPTWPGGVSPLGWLCLAPLRRVRAAEVLQVWVSPRARREGVARRLYAAAIDGDGLTVASGLSQTGASRALWADFVRRGDFAVTARDVVSGRRAPVAAGDGELTSALPLYTDRPRVMDVRLLARRKTK
jgi:hypothetical protein